MSCYCILKTNHDCPESLMWFEEQYHQNFTKIKFKRKKVNSDPLQKQIADDIEEVKSRIGEDLWEAHEILKRGELDEEDIVKFNAVMSYFPKEFTNNQKEALHNLVLWMIKESKKYFLRNGRITSLGIINVKNNP